MMHIAEDSRVDVMSMVVSGGNAVIQRHGVCTVNARGLPTATQGLTHFRDSYGVARNERCAHNKQVVVQLQVISLRF